MEQKLFTIQGNGQITLPVEWMQKYGLKAGDVIAVIEADNALVVLPREAIVMDALDQIGEALKAQGITLEDLMESGRDIRGDILKEKYGIDADNE